MSKPNVNKHIYLLLFSASPAFYRYIKQLDKHEYSNKYIFLKIWISSIWIVSFAMGFVPFFYFYVVKQIDRASGLPDTRWASCGLDMKK